MTSIIMPKAIRDYDVRLNRMKRMKELVMESSDSSSDYLHWSQTDSDYFGSSSSEGDKFDVPARIIDFEPLFLEDSKIGQGYIINLASYRISMSPYINSLKMKEDLDRHWRRKYPHITGIALSKIREEKYEICDVFLRNENAKIPLFILARSWVLFERLILRNTVEEEECKNVLSTCVMMNFKFFMDYGDSFERQEAFK